MVHTAQNMLHNLGRTNAQSGAQASPPLLFHLLHTDSGTQAQWNPLLTRFEVQYALSGALGHLGMGALHPLLAATGAA